LQIILDRTTTVSTCAVPARTSKIASRVDPYFYVTEC
jgi:hypothetical protein